MPPMAAMIGSNAWRNDESSPTSISRFISSPTEKKNTAISASLMKAMMLIGWPWWLKRLNPPIWSATSWVQREL